MESTEQQSMTADPNISTSNPDWLHVAQTAVWWHQAQQIPVELAALLGLLHGTVKPFCVLEIGAADGGSAWAWSQLPSVGLVVSVTLAPGPDRRVPLRDGCAWNIITGDSREQSTLNQVRRQTDIHRPGLVFIDADHSYAAASQDWLNYGGLVAPGGLVVFHDINDVPQHPDVRVSQLWAELWPNYPSLALVAHPGELGGTGILLR